MKTYRVICLLALLTIIGAGCKKDEAVEPVAKNYQVMRWAADPGAKMPVYDQANDRGTQEPGKVGQEAVND